MTIKNNCKTKILVCYYQPCKIIQNDLFFPIQAGKAISGFNLNIQGDDTGDNISTKNTTFGEFTAWYWAWKNIKLLYPDIEYIGLSHYRRFFALDKPYVGDIFINKDFIPSMENYENIITQKLKDNDIILVKQQLYGCNLIQQYAHGHYIEDLIHIKDIIHEFYPEYDKSFLDFFENNNKISFFCMFIAKYDFFDKYFTWLFPLLFEVEKRIDISLYNTYQKRVIAFLAERLLNLYVYHNKLNIVYEPIYFINGIENIISNKNIKYILKYIIKFIIPCGIIECYKLIKNKMFTTRT